jgi:hypothetical protein
MLLTWCKMLLRAIRGPLRTEAQPRPPRSWRGEPLAAIGKPDSSIDSYQTLVIGCVRDGPANSPTPRSPPIPLAHDAPAGLPCSFSESHS